MSDVAVSVRGLGKRYELAHNREPYQRLTETLWNAFRHPLRRSESEEFWALRDVSFDVTRGDVVGIIGRNGAGKSTLLKILSRITEPTEGEAILRGRVSSLLEVGTGFHPELTGRENIYLSGSLLGMRRADIRRRFDEIVAFAEIERFLDTPVKRYSSGMQVRLGFAVAAHLEPDILLVDEVLAVGDAAFRRKSLGRMREVAASGRTVLFVSHDLGAIADLTATAMYFLDGHLTAMGRSESVVAEYLDVNRMALDHAEGPREVDVYRRDSDRSGPIRISHIEALGGRGSTLEFLRPLRFTMTFAVDRPTEQLLVTVMIRDEQGMCVAVLHSADAGYYLSASPGTARVEVMVRDLALTPGRYFADIGVGNGPSVRAFDVVLGVPLVEFVNSGQVQHWSDRPWGVVHPQFAQWRDVVDDT